MDERQPTVAVLAGINGAGKTTASLEILHNFLRIPIFVNADAIARGLNAFDVESQAANAGRVMLEHLRQLAAERKSFAFETTLSGRAYANWLASLRMLGYDVQLFYFWLESVDVAVQRVAERVSAGGHHIPEETIRRRYSLSVRNFFELYSPIADHWRVYDNTFKRSQLIAAGFEDREHVFEHERWDDFVRSAER
ncbi:MAG: zeta toxin family protein [Gemmataceae bacterium]